MADLKISAMDDADDLTGAEYVPLAQGGRNVKATLTDVLGIDILKATLHVTAAQLNNLNGNPIEVIPALGAGFFAVNIWSVYAYSFGTTPYSSAGNVQLWYGDPTDTKPFDQNPDQIINGLSYVQNLAAFQLTFLNNGLDLRNKPINFGTDQDVTGPGDGTLDLTTYYIVIPVKPTGT